MARFIIVGLGSGILFGILDGLINANPLARRFMEPYKPIARKSINVAAGMLIDLVYGFALAGMFLLLFDSLPGAAGIVKGLSFAAGLWFLRVVMNAASIMMMYKIPFASTAYNTATGLLEMLALGILYGLTLWPQ